MKRIKILLVILLQIIIVSCASSETATNLSACIDTNCANYISQSAAQSAFNADPECRNDLDRDNDGIACEEPGNSVKNCGTTSQSGCSGKNKAPCESDSCCRWVVGEGCKGR